MLLIIGTGQSGVEFQLVAGKHVIALVEALNGFRGGRKRLGREILQERQADKDGQQDKQRKVRTPCRGRMPRQQKRDPEKNVRRHEEQRQPDGPPFALTPGSDRQQEQEP